MADYIVHDKNGDKNYDVINELSQSSYFREKSTIVRTAEYIGSFLVTGKDHHERADIVRQKLEEAREPTHSKLIMLLISLNGIKVCSEDGKDMYMAHALRRISYATCDPDFVQFAFLAREPRQQPSSQYCHAFITKNDKEAEELNTIVGEAFRLAFLMQQKEKTPASVAQCGKNGDISSVKDHSSVSNGNDDAKTPMPQQNGNAVVHQTASNEPWRTHHLPPSNEHRLPHADANVEEEDASESARFPTPPPPLNPATSSSAGNTYERAYEGGSDSRSAQSHSGDRGQSNAAVPPQPQRSPLPVPPPRSDSVLSPPPPPQPLTSAAPVSSHHVPHRSGSPSDECSNSYDIADDAERSFLRPTPSAHVSSGNTRRQAATSACGGGSWTQNTSSTSGSSSCDQTSHAQQQHGMPEYSQPPSATSRFSLCAEEASELDNAVWYQPDCSRQVALEYLAKQTVGGFIVRDSGTHRNCYALSVRVDCASGSTGGAGPGVASSSTDGLHMPQSTRPPPTRLLDNSSGIAHYLIQRSSRGVRLKGLEKRWPTLACLIVHLTVMPEMLPCPLVMPLEQSDGGAVVSRVQPPLQSPSSGNAPTSLTDSSQPVVISGHSQSHENCGLLPIPADKDYQCLSDFSSIMADLQLRPSNGTSTTKHLLDHQRKPTSRIS